MINLAELLLELEMFQAKLIEKTTAHFTFDKFFPPIFPAFEILWKNMVEPDRPRKTIWRYPEKMRFACGVTKAKIHNWFNSVWYPTMLDSNT